MARTRTKREVRLQRALHRHGGPKQGSGHAATQASHRCNRKKQHEKSGYSM